MTGGIDEYLRKHWREMIFRILRLAQDEENHQADGEANHRADGGKNRQADGGESRPSSGLILSLSKDADALTPNLG